MAYKAFISYSHAADGKFAPALQDALRKFARPWNRPSAMRVFRDATDLSINPNLWESVCKALVQSEFFILLASPRAAASPWVGKEVDYWLTQRSLDRLLIVLTEGELRWATQGGPASSALPPALIAAIKEEPLYVDMRWAREERNLSLNNPTFRDQVATIAATLRGQPKDELIGEDVTQHRKFKRFVTRVITGLAIATLVALGASWVAWTQRNAAIARGLSTVALLQVTVDPQLGVLLALEAYDRASTQASGAVLREVLIKARVRHEFEAVVDEALVKQQHLQSQVFHESWRIDRLELTEGDGLLRIVEVSTGRQLADIPMDSSRNGVRSVLWSPDGGLLIIGLGDKSAEVWDARTFTRLAVLEGSNGAVDRIAISPDSRLVLVASTDERYGIPLERNAYLFDARNGGLIATLSGHLQSVDDIGFSADSGLAVTRSSDGTSIWNSETGQVVVTNDQNGLTIPSLLDRGEITLVAGEVDTSGDGALTVRNVGFSPDGQVLVTVDRDGKGKLWSVREARVIHTLWAFTDNIRHAFAFSTDGTAVFGRDGDSARAWDVRAGVEIESPPAALAAEIELFLRAPAPDSSDTVHLDSRLILDRSQPENPVLKERATGTMIAGLGSGLVAAALHPDGSRLATVAEESIEVRLTRREAESSLPELIKLARSFVTRGLTEKERARYLR